MNFTTLWKSLWEKLEGALRKAALLIVGIYRTIGTSHMGGCCRFYPSCSDYAQQALHELPVHKAVYVILIRLLKCRPFGPFGFDPVQKKTVECL